MDSDYKVFWTEEAINNLEAILNYLKENWSPREIDNFKKKYNNPVVALNDGQALLILDNREEII